MNTYVRRAGPIVAGLLLVAGCGGGQTDAGSAASSVASAPESAAESGASAAESAASSAASAPAGVAKVSANEASEAELVAALTAAGVDSPDRWAEEVGEYRPYPADDPNFTKLRGELEKYNPGPGVIDQIVSALEP
jgi:hypothetical protein